MKRLVVVACMLVCIISVFGGFSSVTRVNALTPTELKMLGEAFFNTQVDLLNQVKADPSTAGTLAPPPAVIDALIKVITDAKSVFSSTISLSGTDAQVQTSYEKALFAARDYISTEQAKNGQVLRQPYATNLITNFTKSLNDEAFEQKKSVALVAGGYSQQQVDVLTKDTATTNAAAGAAVTQAKTAEIDKSRCSIGLWGNSNIGACISEGVQWLIKNTLLQIYIVWRRFACKV